MLVRQIIWCISCVLLCTFICFYVKAHLCPCVSVATFVNHHVFHAFLLMYDFGVKFWDYMILFIACVLHLSKTMIEWNIACMLSECFICIYQLVCDVRMFCSFKYLSTRKFETDSVDRHNVSFNRKLDLVSNELCSWLLVRLAKNAWPINRMNNCCFVFYFDKNLRQMVLYKGHMSILIWNIYGKVYSWHIT